MWSLSYPMARREGSILAFFFFFGGCFCCSGLVVHSCKNRNPAINLLVSKSQLPTQCYGVTCAWPRGHKKNRLKHFVRITEQKKKIFKKIHISFSSPLVRFLQCGVLYVLYYLSQFYITDMLLYPNRMYYSGK